METKLQQIRDALTRGDTNAALGIANSFPRLGSHKSVIQRAWCALNSPRIYAEIGFDVDQLVQAGVDALYERWDIPKPTTGDDNATLRRTET